MRSTRFGPLLLVARRGRALGWARRLRCVRFRNVPIRPRRWAPLTPCALSRRWLTPPPLTDAGTLHLISAFLCETPLTDWQAFTLNDAQAALEYLVHYTPFESLDYDEAEEAPPNHGNPWHDVLHSYALTSVLRDAPALCPPDIPFY